MNRRRFSSEKQSVITVSDYVGSSYDWITINGQSINQGRTTMSGTYRVPIGNPVYLRCVFGNSSEIRVNGVTIDEANTSGVIPQGAIILYGDANISATILYTSGAGTGPAVPQYAVGIIISIITSKPWRYIHYGAAISASNNPDNSVVEVSMPNSVAGTFPANATNPLFIYGRTVTLNQLADSPTTYSLAASGSYAKFQITQIAGHKYYIYLKNNNNKVRTSANGIFPYISQTALYSGSEGIYTAASTASAWCSLINTTTDPVSGTLTGQIIDLSTIFNSAELTAITSVAKLKTYWLRKFGYEMPSSIPYNTGSILLNNAVYRISCNGVSGGSITAPDLGENDYIYVQQSPWNLVSVKGTQIIDLGDLSWGRLVNASPSNVFYTTSAIYGAQVSSKCAKDYTKSSGSEVATLQDMEFIVYGSTLYIRDTRYSTAAAFKTAVSGIKFAYRGTQTSTISTVPTMTAGDGLNVLTPISGDVRSGAVNVKYTGNLVVRG